MAKKPKQPAPVDPRQTVGDAFAAILRHNFDFLTQWEAAARSPEDIEGVHQIRVSFRRMRSGLATFRPAVPRSVTRTWSEEMRWLANQFGCARDLDVFIDEVLTPLTGVLALPGEARMRDAAEQQRARAYHDLGEVLDGDRYAHFKQDFARWLDDRGWDGDNLKAKHRKRLHRPIVPFARRRLDEQFHEVLAAGDNADQNDADQMHRLRIECKKLRYTADFFTLLFPGMGTFIGHMKGLQDLLGVMHDVAVMPALLDGLLADDRDPDLAAYAGGLVGWRTCEHCRLRDSFNDRWEELIHARRPWWTKAERRAHDHHA